MGLQPVPSAKLFLCLEAGQYKSRDLLLLPKRQNFLYGGFSQHRGWLSKKLRVSKEKEKVVETEPEMEDEGGGGPSVMEGLLTKILEVQQLHNRMQEKVLVECPSSMGPYFNLPSTLSAWFITLPTSWIT